MDAASPEPMKQTISDALAGAIEGYLRFFEATSTLGGALFGVSLFLVVRAIGLVKDEDLAQIGSVSWIVTAGMCGVVVVALGIVAQNTVLSFSVELLLEKASTACAFPDTREPVDFFVNCHRKFLWWLVVLNIGAIVVGLGALMGWFYKQSKRLKK